MPSTTSRCRAKASYKKTPGVLELSHSQLQWTPLGKQAPAVRVATSKAISLFCSKEGSAQVKLKLGLVDNDAGYTFIFTSPQASEERETFKSELTPIIGANRAGNGATPAETPTQTQTQTPTPSPVKPVPTSTPTPIPNAFQQSFPSPASRATSSRASSATPGGPVEDFRLRKKVLVRNAELASLHRELVMSGQITESEFWEGREYLLQAEAAQESQRRGKPGQLVDPRPETVEGGEIKMVITPQLVQDIFEEYPVVAEIYNKTVPKELSEAEFWKRYFQSKLFTTRHQASIRSAATQHVVKDDEIFDKYLTDLDDGVEPQKQRDNDVGLLVNLLATQEDHLETSTQKDATMQAGKQKGALPLIRKFNEHSERLLNAAEGSPSKRRRLENSTESLYEQIDLEDLHDNQSSSGIILEMKDRDRYFEGRMSNGQAADGELRPQFKSVLPELRSQTTDWTTALANLKIEKKAGDVALQTMTHNVHSRLETKTQKNDIPENLFTQMRTCQTAVNEFLRQYWSSIYPSPMDGNTLATPAQKAAKAAKMIGYLSRTPEKIAAIVQTARNEGVDPAKIESAMKPVLNAVEKALVFNKNRKPMR